MKRSSKKRTRRESRKLKLQTLEQRQLLAADFGDTQNPVMAEDVNNDGSVTSIDALMVINRLGRPPVEDLNAPRAFRDVNGDGNVTSGDALRVINRMGRERGGRRDGPEDRPVQDDPNQDNTDQGDSDDTTAEVPSFDGTGNNVDNPLLGSAGTELRRLVESDYADGISAPAGEERASAREISNIVAAQDESILSERRLSDLVWQWGQFIDHDIDLTAEGDGEEFNIAVPAGDPFFDPTGTGEQEIHLERSAVADGTGVDSAREQVNLITSFIDGSMIYGSDDETAESLRAFEGGRLLTSENDLLPIGEDGFFLAGDVRANEQNGLTAMHTLWVREHNRVADEIAAGDPSLSDEEIFQQARSIVVAELQAITFNEYLPTLLGRDAISRYEGYDSTVDPSISNLFATAAFRYGHTSLSSELLRLDDDGNVIEEGNLALRDAFFNPTNIIELGIDPLLKGLASNISQEIDNQLVDDVRNFLFGPPGAGGFDLASLNIQRGRDHGLPDYNSTREQLGLTPAATFADISSDPEVQQQLEEAYGTVDDIDVWVGALAEDHMPGASVGELTQAVLVEQFTALRDGDRFWYENVFEGQQLRELQRTRLSDVIERNTDLTSIQDNAMIVPELDGRRDDRDGNRRRDRGGRQDGTPIADAPLPGQDTADTPAPGQDTFDEALPGQDTFVPTPEQPLPGTVVGQPVPPPANDGPGQVARGLGPQEGTRRGGRVRGGLDTLALDQVLADLGRG